MPNQANYFITINRKKYEKKEEAGLSAANKFIEIIGA